MSDLSLRTLRRAFQSQRDAQTEAALLTGLLRVGQVNQALLLAMAAMDYAPAVAVVGAQPTPLSCVTLLRRVDRGRYGPRGTLLEPPPLTVVLRWCAACIRPLAEQHLHGLNWAQEVLRQAEGGASNPGADELLDALAMDGGGHPYGTESAQLAIQALHHLAVALRTQSVTESYTEVAAVASLFFSAARFRRSVRLAQNELLCRMLVDDLLARGAL